MRKEGEFTKLNLKVRVKNKVFWLTFIPALLLVIQVVLAVFGIQWQPEALNEKIVDVINAVFMLLSILGIVTDPTTAGVGDTDQAMTYDVPKKDIEYAVSGEELASILKEVINRKGDNNE